MHFDKEREERLLRITSHLGDALGVSLVETGGGKCCVRVGNDYVDPDYRIVDEGETVGLVDIKIWGHGELSYRNSRGDMAFVLERLPCYCVTASREGKLLIARLKRDVRAVKEWVSLEDVEKVRDLIANGKRDYEKMKKMLDKGRSVERSVVWLGVVVGLVTIGVAIADKCWQVTFSWPELSLAVLSIIIIAAGLGVPLRVATPMFDISVVSKPKEMIKEENE